MTRLTRGKDAVSLIVQAFLGMPPAFEFAARRLAGRRAVRETMGLVMGDLVPASTAFDPRFLAALLRAGATRHARSRVSRADAGALDRAHAPGGVLDLPRRE